MGVTLEWSKALSTGIVDIDAEHLRLVDKLNALHMALAENTLPPLIVGEMFTEFVATILYHFSFEERLMDKYNYPYTAVHVRQHMYLREQVQSLAKKDKQGVPVVSATLLVILNSWLISHVIDFDKKLGEFLSERGLT
jgi:hemerythrin